MEIYLGRVLMSQWKERSSFNIPFIKRLMLLPDPLPF